MKALTIWQPWASLIMAGAKPYEFRGWRAPRAIIGQRIVIHAAARKISDQDAAYLYLLLKNRDNCDALALEARETCLIADKALPILWQAISRPGQVPLPTGAGLGTAILGEPRLGTEIAEEFGVPRANDSDRDAHANWGWPLTDIEVWDEPVSMRGAQGFWTWPTPADALL